MQLTKPLHSTVFLVFFDFAGNEAQVLVVLGVVVAAVVVVVVLVIIGGITSQKRSQGE